MRLVFTDEAQKSMNDSFSFLLEQGVSDKKIDELRERIRLRARQLLKNPYMGSEN